MADRTLQLDIVTPDRVVLSEPVVFVSATGTCGSFGILYNHAPLLTELAVGQIRYRNEPGHEIVMATSGGFLQVFNNHVTILADSAERSDEIDLDQARATLDQARDELHQAAGMIDQAKREQLQAAVRAAENRIRIAG